MAGRHYAPLFGLPLADVLAALRAVEPILPRIDGRILEVRALEDGSLTVKTGELLAVLDGRGNLLRLQKGVAGWEVTDFAEWGS